MPMRAVGRTRLYILQAAVSKAVRVQQCARCDRWRFKTWRGFACQNACSSEYSTDTGRPTLSGFAVYVTWYTLEWRYHHI